MLVSELLELVDVMIPNSINIPIKLAWMNQIQNQFFRDYPLADAIGIIDIKVNREFYALPEDCPEDRIEKLVLGDDELPYIPLPEESDRGSTPFWTITVGTILIYPPPKEIGTAYLFYKPRPIKLTAASLDTSSTFPPDFQEMLIFGCASRIAKANGQLQLANVFDSDFLRLADLADRNLTKKRQNTTSVVRGWY